MKQNIIRIFILTLFIFLVLPMISADTIMVDHRMVPIDNQIINSSNFPDYVFISYGIISPSMCPIKIILSSKASSISDGYYKQCNPSVFAIEKSKFNETKIELLNSSDSSNTEVLEYFNSIGAKEIIKDIRLNEAVPNSDTTAIIQNSYVVDLTKTKDKPDKTIRIDGSEIYHGTKDNLLSLYILSLLILSGASLIAMIYIIIKNRRNST